MALACKCDRCGKLFEAYIKKDKIKNLMVRTIYPDSGNEVSKQKFDLCENCSNGLDVWIEAGKTNESK